MALLRFTLIVAGLVLAFACKPFLWTAIGGAVVFLIMKAK